MEIDLDMAVLDNTIQTYGETLDVFSAEKDNLRSHTEDLLFGWKGHSFDVFLTESDYILSTVFVSGIEGIEKSKTMLDEVKKKAEVLRGRASFIAGILTGSIGTASSTRLCYNSDDAEYILIWISDARDILSDMKECVEEANRILGTLKSTKCDIDYSSISDVFWSRSERLDLLEDRIGLFKSELIAFAETLSEEAAFFYNPPNVVVGAADIYSDGVLDLEEIRYLMDLPEGMLTPAELAALSSALETLMGEAYDVGPNDPLDETTLALLAEFLGCCYDTEFSLAFATPEDYICELSLKPHFSVLAEYVARHTDQSSSPDLKSTASWLMAIERNASTIYQVGAPLNCSPPDIKLRGTGDGQSLETYFDNCMSGRVYNGPGVESYHEADRDLRFVVTRDTNTAYRSYNDFIGADIFTDSSGVNPTINDRVFDYFMDNVGQGVEGVNNTLEFAGDQAIQITIDTINPMEGLNSVAEAAGAACFVYTVAEQKEYHDMRDALSAQLRESLTTTRDSLDNYEGFSGSLNADGTVSIYGW